jgi:hypothetical protein
MMMMIMMYVTNTTHHIACGRHLHHILALVYPALPCSTEESFACQLLCYTFKSVLHAAASAAAVAAADAAADAAVSYR